MTENVLRYVEEFAELRLLCYIYFFVAFIYSVINGKCHPGGWYHIHRISKQNLFTDLAVGLDL